MKWGEAWVLYIDLHGLHQDRCVLWSWEGTVDFFTYDLFHDICKTAAISVAKLARPTLLLSWIYSQTNLLYTILMTYEILGPCLDQKQVQQGSFDWLLKHTSPVSSSTLTFHASGFIQTFGLCQEMVELPQSLFSCWLSEPHHWQPYNKVVLE